LVYKVAIADAVVAWLLMQIASQIFPFLEIPNWAVRLVVLLLIIGFPIALILAWAFELTPEGIKRAEFADELPKKAPGSRAWIYVVIIAGAISVSLFFLGRYTSSKQGSEVAAKSIAVLPFDNQNRDPDTEYLSDGIPESIIHSLSQLPNLKVMSRNSVFHYKGKNTDAQAVAKDLKVQAVLTGRMTQRGDAVSISVELINAQDNSEIWGQQYKSQTRRCVRSAGRDRERDFREAKLEVDGRRKATVGEASHRESQGFPILHAGTVVRPTSRPGGSAHGHRLLRQGN